MRVTRRTFLTAIGVSTGNIFLGGCIPLAQRIQDEETSSSSRITRQPQEIFSKIDQGTPILSRTQYLDQQKQLQRQLRDSMARYRATFQQGQDRSYEALIEQVITPYARMVNLAFEADQVLASQVLDKSQTFDKETIVIPPGGILAYTQKGCCMDPSLPAPVKNDALVLQPASVRVSADLLPLYRAIGRWATNEQNTGRAQSLIWILMGAGSETYNWLPKMPNETRQLLNQIMPGGADLIIRVHNTRKLERDIVRGLMKASKLNQVIDPNVVLRTLSEGNTRSIMAQLIRDGERMTGGKGIGYSNIAPEVVARAYGTNPLEGRIEIANAGSSSFPFSPLDYFAAPIVKKQSISGSLFLKDVSLRSLQPLSKDESKAVTNLAVDMGKDLSKYLLQKGWEGAWNSLAQKTPAASLAARKAMSAKMGQGTVKLIGGVIGATPILGNALSLYEFVSGKDFMTGETLGAAERLLAGIGTVPGANMLRNLGRGIQYAEGAASLARISDKAAFRIIDQTAVGRDIAGFLVSDSAKNMNVWPAVLNDQSKAVMQNLIINTELPWQASTAQLIKDLKTGDATW